MDLDLNKLTLHNISQALDAGSISSVELCNAYLARIDKIEDKIDSEIDLAGVSSVENGEDQLELEGRLKALRSLLSYYQDKYDEALIAEGGEASSINFIPRRMMGN